MIELSIEDPDASRVLFPSRERESIDWDTLNKLTMNADVLELLTRIKNDLQTKEFIEEKYDKVYDVKGLSQLIKKKG